jgi:hypothetical protein
MAKRERNKALIKFLDNHTLSEAAEKFGISRQRVFQITEMYGVDLKSRDIAKGAKVRAVRESGLLGSTYDAEVARQTGVSETMVSFVRRGAGIPRFAQSIGCEKCKTKPYSRGLCKACYCRQWRAKKRD